MNNYYVDTNNKPESVFEHFRKLIRKTNNVRMSEEDFNELDYEDAYNYNCWCFTSLLMGWENEPDWYQNEDMLENLKNYSKPISKRYLKAGDIVVWGNGDKGDLEEFDLSHTGVIIEKTKDSILVLHKDGGYPRCVEELDKDATCDNYGPAWGFRRPIEKEKLTNV